MKDDMQQNALTDPVDGACCICFFSSHYSPQRNSAEMLRRLPEGHWQKPVDALRISQQLIHHLIRAA